jgi:hypothetical protein
MRFYVPSIEENKEEDFLKDSILPHLESMGYSGFIDKRVYSISFFHHGEYLTDTVGEISISNNEPIFLILETDKMFLVCTTHRGILGGEPLITGKSNVESIIYFDNNDKNTYVYKDWTYKLDYGSHYVNSPKDLPSSLYKYYNNNSNNRNAIIDSYCYCSHPYQLNDSMDCNNLLWNFKGITKSKFDDFCDAYKDSPLLIGKCTFEEDKSNNFEFIKTAFWHIVTDKAGIISFTQNPLNTLMWSHYASEKGLMIEFDRENLISHFKKLNPNMNNYVFMPIQYVEDLEMVDFFSKLFTTPDIPFLYSINVKKKDWEYENEWRLVCYSDSYGVPCSIIKPESDINGEYPRKFFYDKNVVRSITLGKYFFNGSNLKTIIEPDIYEIIESDELHFIDFICSNFNEMLYISDESTLGSRLQRNRIQIQLEKLDNNVFRIRKK